MAPNRLSTAAAAAAAISPSTLTPLPAYEPPLTPFTPGALTALTTLADNNGRPTPLAKLSHSVSQALDKLSEAAADLADHVPAGADAEHRGRQQLLDALEAQARALVDGARVVADVSEVLALVVRDAREEAGRAAAAHEEGAQAAVGTGVVGAFTARMAERGVSYDGLSMRAKYGDVAEYVQFRRLVWSAQHDNENMPKASAWFRHLEGPRPGGRQQAADDDGEDDDDSDIEIAQEVHSYQCPLTLRRFVEPYTSAVCPHSFERAAIQEYIRGGGGGGVSCPVAGCSQRLTLADVKPDVVLERRVRREAARERRRVEEEEEEEGEEGEMADVDVDVQEAPRVKREGGRRGGRARVVDVSDGEEHEDEE